MAVCFRGVKPVIASLVMVFLALAPWGAEARTAVTGTRVGIHPEGITRFVMDISAPLEFKVTTHADPMRVVVNTDQVSWSPESLPSKTIGSVARLRYEEGGEGGRIVLVLDKPAEVKQAFLIAPRDGQGWRFAMDLRETTKAAFLASATKPPATKPAKAEPAKTEPTKPEIAKVAPPPAPVVVPPAAPVAVPAPAPVASPIVVVSPAAAAPEPRPVARPTKGGAVLTAAMPPPPERPATVPAVVSSPEPVAATKVAAPLPAPEPAAEPKVKSGDGRPVIVIDPGHGGVDPGAIGVSGAYEKHITLAVARELKEQLEKTGRYKVHLTRDRDVFIRLRDRITQARQFGADLFVSLHADAVQNPQIRGLSVYTLSQNASDSEAQALAEKENKADLIAGIDLSHESADVANILIDLAQRETMNRSAVFAGGLVDEVGRATTLLGNTHRFAGFAVLKAPDVPSVLVELGYLSHEGEERQLRQAEYREKLARAIARSVDSFFLQGQRAKRP